MDMVNNRPARDLNRYDREMEPSAGRKHFYQSKYEFYRRFSLWVVVVSCLASVTYFVSDCQLFDRFAVETLLPRTIILLPMGIYILLYHKLRDYRIMVPFSYVILHLIMWNTIWAIYFLPDRTHASEGFIIMHLMFLAMGFCSPFPMAAFFNLMVITNILVSNLFNHYENLDIMLSLGIPCAVAITVVHYVMQNLYRSNYETRQKLEKMSRFDMLTGVNNRYVIEDITDPETGCFVEGIGNPAGILILDIDYFKRVNDTHGHLAGDKVLQALSDLLVKNIKPEDFIIRWGGEEFVLILPDRTLEEAALFARILRRKAEEMDTGVCPITISVGVTVYRGGDYKLAISEADGALYAAKSGGRNLVRLYAMDERIVE